MAHRRVVGNAIRQVPQHPFNSQLGAPVRRDRVRCLDLGYRRSRGVTVNRCARGKDKRRDTMLVTCFDQAAGGNDIVVIIFNRIGNRLWYYDVAGKMKDRRNVIVFQ